MNIAVDVFNSIDIYPNIVHKYSDPITNILRNYFFKECVEKEYYLFGNEFHSIKCYTFDLDNI